MNQPSSPKPTVLITGCSGLIGSTLIDELHHDYQIIGIDVDQPDQLPPGVNWLECDLTDDQSVAQCLEQVSSLASPPIASVIHLAAYYDFSGEPSPLYDKLTVEGTRRLLRGLQPLKVEQFMFASTLLVMKSAAETGKTLTEDSPIDAEWAYPQSKVRAEEVMQQEQGSIPVVVHRVAGVFNEDCNSLPISQQIKRINEKDLESHFFPGDASHGQPFIHLSDLTDCFRKSIENRKQLDDYEVFLIAEEKLMSYDELQDTIGTLVHGDQWTTIRIPKAVAKAGAWVKSAMSSEDDQPFIQPWMVDLADQHYPIDVNKARAKLGWEPKHTLRDTLPAMIAKLQRDPVHWYQLNGLQVPQDMKQS